MLFTRTTHNEDGFLLGALQPRPNPPVRTTQGVASATFGWHRGAASRQPRKGEGGGAGGPQNVTQGGRGTPAGPRPRASDWCKLGRQGSPPPASPSGDWVAGASMAGGAPTQGRQRPAAARSLFALGFTRAAAVSSPRDEEQGGAPAPPRGSDTPGKGHGRANSENT